jgi:hypothetical protein
MTRDEFRETLLEVGLNDEDGRSRIGEILSEYDRLTAALTRIASFTKCDGPGCYFCENEDEKGHPSSAEATIAREALEVKK